MRIGVFGSGYVGTRGAAGAGKPAENRRFRDPVEMA
jgi:hypothetical protein